MIKIFILNSNTTNLVTEGSFYTLPPKHLSKNPRTETNFTISPLKLFDNATESFGT